MIELSDSMLIILQAVVILIWIAYGFFVASKNVGTLEGSPFTSFSLIMICIVGAPLIFIVRALAGAFYLKKFL